MNRKIKTLPTLKIPLFEVTIDRHADARVDKYRANSFSPTTLYHATLKDGGDNSIPVVAKVIISRRGKFTLCEKKNRQMDSRTDGQMDRRTDRMTG